MNEVLEKLRFVHDTGTLDFQGIRYMLIRPETIVEIQKVIEETCGKKTAHEILYKCGLRGTSLTARKLLDKGHSPEQCLREMFAMGTFLGWGKFQAPEITQVGETIGVTIAASPFATAYGPSNHPTCVILRGALAGIFSTIYGGEYVCREIKCAASGDSTCHFLLERDL